MGFQRFLHGSVYCNEWKCLLISQLLPNVKMCWNRYKRCVLPLRHFCWKEIQPHSHPQNSESIAIWFISAESADFSCEFAACVRQIPEDQTYKFIAVSLSLSLYAFKMLLRIASLSIHQETQINRFWQQALLLSEPHALSGYYMKISSWYTRPDLSQLRWIALCVGKAIRGYNPHILRCWNAEFILELASLIQW